MIKDCVVEIADCTRCKKMSTRQKTVRIRNRYGKKDAPDLEAICGVATIENSQTRKNADNNVDWWEQNENQRREVSKAKSNTRNEEKNR